MKPILEFPPTIRPLREDEVPNKASILERIELSKKANIVPGFTIIANKDQFQGYDFYAEININNSSLWELVIALTETLSEVSSLLFGYSDSDLNYGKYLDKNEIIDFISQYKVELTQDVFINFGFIYNDEKELTEIFVDESKFIKYWGSDKELFLRIMRGFGLNQVEDIEFIDEYPKVRKSLKLHDETTLQSEELMEILINQYL